MLLSPIILHAIGPENGAILCLKLQEVFCSKGLAYTATSIESPNHKPRGIGTAVNSSYVGNDTVFSSISPDTFDPEKVNDVSTRTYHPVSFIRKVLCKLLI